MVDDKETPIVGNLGNSFDDELDRLRDNGLRVYPAGAIAGITLHKPTRLNIPICKTIDVVCLGLEETLDLKILVPDPSYLREIGTNSLFLIGKTPEEDEFDFYSIFDMGDIGTVNPIYTSVSMDHKVNFNHYGVASIEIDSVDLNAITIPMSLDGLLSRPYLENTNLRRANSITAETGELLIKKAYGPERLGIIAYHPRLKIAMGDVIKLGDPEDYFGELSLSFFFSEVYDALPYHNRTAELIANMINPLIQKNTLGYFARMNGRDQELMDISEVILESKDYLKRSAFKELSFVTFGLVTETGDSNLNLSAKYALEFLEDEYEISGHRLKHFNGVHSEQLNLFRGIKARLNPQTGTLFMYGLEKNQQVQLGNYHVLR